MWACNKGHEDVVDCLLKYGADVNIQDVSEYDTGYHWLPVIQWNSYYCSS